jgi:adenylate cyclase
VPFKPLNLQTAWRSRNLLLIAPGVAIFTILGNAFGTFNLLEWGIRDEFFRIRPAEPIESEIVIVTIDEPDIKAIGDWPIPDETLAKLLTRIRDQNPRAIGLDLYRDLPEEPGHQQLQAVFRTTPNLFGVEKLTPPSVPAPPILKEAGQAGLADLVADADRKVRRGLLTAEDKKSPGTIKIGLATQVALKYLEAEKIELTPIGQANEQKYQLGKAIYTPLLHRDAGYLGSDLGGYQILMNWRGARSAFPEVTMSDVLAGKIPADLMRDRMVFIGSIAPSTNDFFETPYSSSWFAAKQMTPGVTVHANIASQLIRSAKEGRVSLHGFTGPAQWGWIIFWAGLGSWGSWWLAAQNHSKRQFLGGYIFWLTLGLSGSLLGGGYFVFLQGLLIPIVPALVALITSVVTTTHVHKQQRLEMAKDQLELANQQLELTNGQLETTNQQLETANQQLETTNQQLEITNGQLETTNQQLETANQKLRDYSQTLENQTDELSQSLDQLQQAQLQLVQSEKMSTLGQLVAGVAHEINNPVGFITNNLSCLQDYTRDVLDHLQLYQAQYPQSVPALEDHAEEVDLEFLLEDLPNMITSMQTGVHRIKDISTSLRTFSRSDTQTQVSFNIHEGIDSTLLILGHRIKANEQRPAVKIDKEYEFLSSISCYPGQLNQVFMNILANAIDAMDESNQDLSFHEIAKNPNRIMIRITAIANEQVLVTIKDNGPGMPESVKEKIFENLFTTKGVGKGTGLGLAIARQIVEERHGGKLEVNSAPGEGAEFAITLPIAGTLIKP